MKLGGFILAALMVSVLLAVFGAPFASSSPDGLERVAADKGFIEKASAAPAWSYAPAPDYSTPGVGSVGLSMALAGLLGTLATFGAAWGLAKWVARRKEESGPKGQA